MSNSNLLKVAAKDVSSRFGYYTDEAMLRPVGIQRHGKTRIVMISLAEYERLLRRDRRVILTKDLDEDALEAIFSAKVPESSRALDILMDDSEAD